MFGTYLKTGVKTGSKQAKMLTKVCFNLIETSSKYFQNLLCPCSDFKTGSHTEVVFEGASKLICIDHLATLGGFHNAQKLGPRPFMLHTEVLHLKKPAQKIGVECKRVCVMQVVFMKSTPGNMWSLKYNNVTFKKNLT